MINTEAVFQRLNLGSSRTDAVQRIRELVEGANDPAAKASGVIKDILGLETKYEDDGRALHIAQKVAEEVFKANHKVDNENELLTQCEKFVDAFRADPKNAWMFAKPTRNVEPTETKQVVKGIDTKVEVKANGKIKKGGKQVLAAELYKKHVLEAKKAATNQEFIAILVKELGMSKAGATTYAYNCKKQLGEPAGGIVKAKKGRKAKAK